MIILIAWRNVWRNWKRSLIIITAIALGLWAGLFSMAVSLGLITQMVNTILATQLSHIQIHQPGFLQHHEIGLVMDNGPQVLEYLRRDPAVKALSGRSLIMGMASSATTASGASISGIIPSDESRTTDVAAHIVEGTYFGTNKRNPVVIGKKLAGKLNVRIGSKIVLTAQSRSGELGAGAFRVVGIYQTSTTTFDEMSIFVQQSDADRTFDLGGAIHEIAMILNDPAQSTAVAAELSRRYPDLDVQEWKSLSPELAMATEQTGVKIYVFLIIILLALVFGITNTMLMSVIERTRELGMVMALGMKGTRVFAMIFFETLFLSIIGAIAGIALGAGTIAYFGKFGLDLSKFAEGMAAFGFGARWYPSLPFSQYPVIVLLVMLTAFVSALYPGIKAVRLKPVEAIRTY